MAVNKAIPAKFARIHPKYLMPTWSTISRGIVSAAFCLVFTLIGADTLLQALVGSILLVVFIYGLAQFALPDWIKDNTGHNVTIFGIGATAAVGVVGLLIGPVLRFLWDLRQPEFFQGKTLPRRSEDLVLSPGEGCVPTFALPDSGRMPELIAPDLSNLPPGQSVMDVVTGEELPSTPSAAPVVPVQK